MLCYAKLFFLLFLKSREGSPKVFVKVWQKPIMRRESSSLNDIRSYKRWSRTYISHIYIYILSSFLHVILESLESFQREMWKNCCGKSATEAQNLRTAQLRVKRPSHTQSPIHPHPNASWRRFPSANVGSVAARCSAHRHRQWARP